ncbi:MAG: fibronectin type III domain-containing protein, partial [Syntrophomonadaceae bacterium]|nr:fibronectin type III domain-containing protein [Syntrophomonadaceae bacterium]
MLKKSIWFIIIVLLFIVELDSPLAMAVETGNICVPITVKESAGVDAGGFPVTAVVPLPYGKYQNIDCFRLTDASGNTIKAQFDVLNRHYSKDNSIRHLTVNFFTNVEANSSERFYLKDDGSGNIPGNLNIIEEISKITVNTGVMEFVVNKQNFSLIDSLRYDGHDVILSDPLNGGILKDRFDNMQIESGMTAPNVSIEERGPIRTVIRLELPARFRTAGQYADLTPGLDNVSVPLGEGDYTHTHGYCVRIYAYEGQSLLRVDFTLENSDKTVLQSWPLYFKEFSLGLKVPAAMDRVRIGTWDDTQGRFFDSNGNYLDQSDDQYELFDQNVATQVYVSQDIHDHYSLYQEDNSQTAEDDSYSKTGQRAAGWLDRSDENHGLQVAVKDFWQTWPNALQATQDDRLLMHMFSPWAKDGYFDWSNSSVYTPTNTGLYWIDDMQHITKTYWLNAHSSISNTELERINRLFQKQPVAVIPMDWYKETAVTLDMNGLIPRTENVASAAGDIWFYNEAANINSHFYHFGYDNYMADEGRRKGNTTGGWPHSSAWFIASENPVDYYTSEARIFGDLNARPQHLADYDYENDKINNLVPLDIDPYDTRSWRYWKHNFAYPKEFAPYLDGTYWSGYNSRDFEHLWMYETEEFYNLSADRRIYDWYTFIGEFLKSYVLGSENCPYDVSDEGTTHATRAEGHVLNTLLQAYRVVGDPTYLDAAKVFVSDLKKNQTKYGNQKTSVFLDSPFQTAYLARGVINYLDLVEGYDQKAYLEGFSYLQGLIEWNYYYGSYEYFLETDNMTDRYGNAVDGDPTGFLLVDPASWYYWHSGDQRILDHMLLYINGDLEVEEENFALPSDMKEWKGDFGGRWSHYVINNEKTDKIPPLAVTDLQATDLGNGQVKLCWSGDGEADWYWVKWSDRPIVEEHTAADAFCNWWDGESAVNSLSGAGSKELIIDGLADNATLYFAVKSVDKSDNISTLSNVIKLSRGTGDVILPSAVTDLALTAQTENTATLQWTIPGDDNEQGTAAAYIIKISHAPLDESNFDAAQPVANPPLPKRNVRVEPLNKQSFTLTGLEKYQTYYVALQSQDDVGNNSVLSNVQCFTLEDADVIPPATISDLQVENNDLKGIQLSWTVPGDNGDIGQASVYDIRYAAAEITSENWGSATQVAGEPVPLFPGDNQKYTVKTLDSNTTYYFAIRTGDEAENWSDISNPATATTGEVDRIAPDGITDLSAGNVTDISVELKWNATGDDGVEGLASAYQLAYATQSFGVEEWDQHVKTIDLPLPLAAGTSQSILVTGLNRSTTYYFAVRVIDNAENYSPLSNLLTLSTEDAPSIAVGKTVTTNEVHPGNLPSNLVDGNNSIPWVSDYNPNGSWVQIDLDAYYNLSGADVIHLNSWDGYGHRIDVSNDGQTWNTMASMLPNARTGKVSHTFNADYVRYVRLVIADDNFEQQRVCVGELKVYGTLSPSNQFNVSFDSNGGSPVDSQIVNINNNVVEPSIPVKNGYIFAGWYSDAELKTAFSFATAITSNT